MNWRALIKAIGSVVSGAVAILFFGGLIASSDALFGIFMVSATIFAIVLAVHMAYLEFCEKDEQ